MIDVNSLPTIEDSLADKRNDKPARSYPKEEVYTDEDGYQRFTSNNFLVLNSDGSARKGYGRPKGEVSTKLSRNQRRALRKQKLLESKADIKQRDLLKRLDRAAFDVVGELIDIYEEDDTNKDQRIRILFKFAEHAFPKLSVLNTNAETMEGFTFNINTKPSQDVENKKAAIKEALQ